MRIFVIWKSSLRYTLICSNKYIKWNLDIDTVYTYSVPLNIKEWQKKSNMEKL